MSLISLIHTTARPEKWFAACNDWYKNCSSPEQVEYVLVPERKFFNELFEPWFPFENSKWGWNPGRPCLVDGYNHAAKISTGSVLVLVADDYFSAPGWDERLLQVLGDKTDKEAVVWAATGGGNDKNFIVMPILTRQYYSKYGYVFWPEYQAWCADNEFDVVARRDGVIIDARTILKFDHKHPSHTSTPSDEIYRKQETQSGEARSLFVKRQGQRFPR